MAMTMNGQVQLPAAREVVWEKLNDPEVLKSCIPGSEQLDRIADNEFQAIATVKVGPVKARWKGKVQALRPRPAEQLSHFRRRGGRRRGLCQRGRQGVALRQGWRDAAHL